LAFLLLLVSFLLQQSLFVHAFQQMQLQFPVKVLAQQSFPLHHHHGFQLLQHVFPTQHGHHLLDHGFAIGICRHIVAEEK
jgi:hypothetical protein